MKLSMETRDLALTFGIRKALKLMKDAGFDAADLTLDKINPDDDLLDRPDRVENAHALRAYVDELEYGFTQAHAPFKVVYGDPFDMSCPAYAAVVHAMEVASILGIPHIIVHAIKTPREDLSIDYKEYNRRYYLSLLPYCEQYGIKIAVENLFWKDKLRACYFGLFPTPAEITEFVDSLGSPYFIVCCDLGHAAITGVDPETYIRGMDNRHLRSLHIQDTDFLGDRHYLPYTGKHNWDAVCRALAEIDYNADFSLEILHFIDRYPPELMPDALVFAEKVGRYLVNTVEKFKLG